MKNYLITVNGTTYEVQVEELGESAATAKKTADDSPPKAAPAAQTSFDDTPVPAAVAAAPSAVTGKLTIKCPMPGTIVKINVAVGDKVENGDVVCVLEAMKMENEIKTPQDGVIASINTTKGASVNSGDILFSIS